MGKRLKNLTSEIPKCLIKVNKTPLIERMLKQLDKLKLTRIIIVTGFKSKILVDFINKLNIKTKIIFIENKEYEKTNNIYSLYLAKKYLKEENTLLLESDLIFEDSILKTIIKNPEKNLVMVSKFESWMNGTVVKLGNDNNISSFLSKEDLILKKKINTIKQLIFINSVRNFLPKPIFRFLKHIVKHRESMNITNKY